MCDVVLVGSHFWRAWGLGSPDGFPKILIFSSRKDILTNFPNNKRFGLWISWLSWFGSDAAWDECVFSSATFSCYGPQCCSLQAEQGSLHELEAKAGCRQPLLGHWQPWCSQNPNLASLDAVFFPRPWAAAPVRRLVLGWKPDISPVWAQPSNCQAWAWCKL